MSKSGDDTKKRRLNDGEEDASATINSSPIVYLNVGGATRNVRRSLLNDLRDASRSITAGEPTTSNPLCDVLLLGSEHWSNVPTTTDASDGTIRIYLDRNPKAFDDLLEYIEYGKLFLEEIINKDGADHGSRLKRLSLECDFFTVGTLSDDVDAVVHQIDEVVYGEPVSFRSDSWFSVAGEPIRRNNETVGWDWGNGTGNTTSIASHDTSPHRLGQCKIQTSGTYLVFFSLQSVAVTSLAPNTGYVSERTDEFCQLSIFHETMTQSESGHWTYPIARCGAFDYRTDSETRKNDPLIFTASCVEPISLRKGNVLYCQHGTGVLSPTDCIRTTALVSRHGPFSREESGCANFISLVRIFGDNMMKWNVKRDKDPNAEPSSVAWTEADSNSTSRPSVCLDDKDETKIRFKKAGYYLLLGRVAGRLEKNRIHDHHSATIQLELMTNGGMPLHISPELVSYPGYKLEDMPYNKKRVDYGHINDIVYVESDSFIRVRGTGGACIAHHGAVPSKFEKIPAQSLSALRLDPSMRVDRYQLSIVNNGVLSCERALGGDDRVLLKHEPLFTIEDCTLTAVRDCQCIVVGSLSSLAGMIASLSINWDAIVHSQVCKDGSYGSHSLSAVIGIKKDDDITITCRDGDDINDNIPNVGHLAFVVLDS